jgi:hypothetical protein
MELTAPFDVNLSNGTTAKFQSAQLDVVAGTLNTDDPVAIDTEQASIVAQSLRMTDKGGSSSSRARSSSTSIRRHPQPRKVRAPCSPRLSDPAPGRQHLSFLPQASR